MRLDTNVAASHRFDLIDSEEMTTSFPDKRKNAKDKPLARAGVIFGAPIRPLRLPPLLRGHYVSTDLFAPTVYHADEGMSMGHELTLCRCTHVDPRPQKVHPQPLISTSGSRIRKGVLPVS
jgi:hypothetical protein